MSERFIPVRAHENKLTNVPHSNGQIIITDDSKNLYIDFPNNQRIRITDIIYCETIEEYNNANKIANKLYLIKDPKAIHYYTGSTDVELVGPEADYYITTSEFETSTTDINGTIWTSANINDIIQDAEIKPGKIIIDKYGSYGIIDHVDNIEIIIVQLTNNKSSSIITNFDIYIDTSFTGVKNVGTFSNPFVNWQSMLQAPWNGLNYPIYIAELLQDESAYITIHLMSNSSISIDTDVDGYNNVKIVNDARKLNSASSANILMNSNILNSNNIVFDNVIIKSSNNTFTIDKSSNIVFEHCELNTEIVYKDSKIHNSDTSFNGRDITISDTKNDATITDTSNEYTFANGTVDLTITSNSRINALVNIYHSENISLNGNTTTSVIMIQNSDVNVNVNNGSELYMKDSICRILNIAKYEYILFEGGGYWGNTTPSLEATSIDLGTFNFRQYWPTITGDVDVQSGLHSSQVHDYKVRNYHSGFLALPTEETPLNKHLDAIDESMLSVYHLTSTLAVEDDSIRNNSISFIEFVPTKTSDEDNEEDDNNVNFDEPDVIWNINSVT